MTKIFYIDIIIIVRGGITLKKIGLGILVFLLSFTLVSCKDEMKSDFLIENIEETSIYDIATYIDEQILLFDTTRTSEIMQDNAPNDFDVSGIRDEEYETIPNLEIIGYLEIARKALDCDEFIEGDSFNCNDMTVYLVFNDNELFYEDYSELRNDLRYIRSLYYNGSEDNIIYEMNNYQFLSGIETPKASTHSSYNGVEYSYYNIIDGKTVTAYKRIKDYSLEADYNYTYQYSGYDNFGFYMEEYDAYVEIKLLETPAIRAITLFKDTAFIAKFHYYHVTGEIYQAEWNMLFAGGWDNVKSTGSPNMECIVTYEGTINYDVGVIPCPSNNIFIFIDTDTVNLNNGTYNLNQYNLSFSEVTATTLNEIETNALIEYEMALDDYLNVSDDFYQEIVEVLVERYNINN